MSFFWCIAQRFDQPVDRRRWDQDRRRLTKVHPHADALPDQHLRKTAPRHSRIARGTLGEISKTFFAIKDEDILDIVGFDHFGVNIVIPFWL